VSCFNIIGLSFLGDFIHGKRYYNGCAEHCARRDQPGINLGSAAERARNQQWVDPTISKFVGNIIKYGIIAFVVIAALGRIGIATASFVAVLGAAGLAIGLALQGSLSNFSPPA